MTGLVLCALAFAVTFAMTRRSLGHGIIAVLAFGYAYGLVRARVYDTAAHFMFDAALVGLYLGAFAGAPPPAILRRGELARVWAAVLMAWPLVCIAYAPIIAGTQPVVIQLVGYRAMALTVPCLVLGARLTRVDMDRLAPAIAILNLVALLFGGLEFIFGVQTFIPHNEVSDIVYQSQDIASGNELFFRIPATFLDSHVYGAVMALTIPFVAHGLESGRRVRILCWCGLAAAAMGVFLCGARLPVVTLVAATLYVLFSMRIRATMFLAVAITGIIVFFVVAHFERFQRFTTLSDTDAVTVRLRGSVNTTLIDSLLSYPLGAGLGSAWGTSIPYFLQSQALPQIGVENEYGHIALEQGVIGLGLWLAFIVSCVLRKPASVPGSGTAMAFQWAFVIMAWGSGALGVGVTAGIPSALLLLLLMGMRFALAPVSTPQKALRHVGQARPISPRAGRLAHAEPRTSSRRPISWSSS
jgi:hypothetical protein